MVRAPKEICRSGRALLQAGWRQPDCGSPGSQMGQRHGRRGNAQPVSLDLWQADEPGIRRLHGAAQHDLFGERLRGHSALLRELGGRHRRRPQAAGPHAQPWLFRAREHQLRHGCVQRGRHSLWLFPALEPTVQLGLLAATLVPNAGTQGNVSLLRRAALSHAAVYLHAGASRRHHGLSADARHVHGISAPGKGG